MQPIQPSATPLLSFALFASTRRHVRRLAGTLVAKLSLASPLSMLATSSLRMRPTARGDGSRALSVVVGAEWRAEVDIDIQTFAS